ncbi:hypothetical protein WKI67_00825, partial [Streptomyces sp. MS2.AVA.5]
MAIAAAWILATPITHLTLLRAHLLTPHRFRDLLALRRRTGVLLVLVCHHRAMRAFLERGLRQVEHRIAEASTLLPEAEPIALERQTPQAKRPLASRWISLPALTTLKALGNATGLCRCAAPVAAGRDSRPPVMPPVTGSEVAWRLHRATAHPYLAGSARHGCVHRRFHHPAQHRARPRS